MAPRDPSQTPGFARNFLAGMDMGRERRLQDEAIAKQNQLARLAGDAFAMPESRAAILPEIARLDPGAAFEMQGAFDRQSQQSQRAEQTRIGNMAKLLASAPAQARGSIYSRLRPSLQSMGLEAPEQWDDSLLPVVQSLGGVGAASDNLTPSMRSLIWQRDNGVIGPDEFRQAVRILNRQDAAAQNPQFSVQRVEQADGTVRFERIPTRGGNVTSGAPPLDSNVREDSSAPVPSTASGSSPSPKMDAILAQANAMARRGVPDAQIERFIAGAAKRQGVTITPAQMEANANATLDAQTYGGAPPTVAPPIGSPAGQATNATRAAAEADAAAQRVRAETLARAEAERVADEPQRERAAQALAETINTVAPVLDEAIGQVSGWTAGAGSWLAVLPGTPATNLQRNLETLQARLSFDELSKMRAASPTGGALGAVSERELTLLGATVRSLSQDQSPAQLKRNLEAIKYHYDRWLMTTKGINPDEQQSEQQSATVVRTGRTADGRRVRQMSDGRILDESGQEVRL